MGNEPSSGALHQDLKDVRRQSEAQSMDGRDSSADLPEAPECVFLLDTSLIGKPKERNDMMGAAKAMLFGQEQRYSILMHASSSQEVSQTFDIAAGYRVLAFNATIDDRADGTSEQKQYGLCQDPIVFEVLGTRDNNQPVSLWRSNPIQSRNQAVKGKVDVSGVRALTLRVRAERGRAANSYAVWLNPRLFIAPGVRAAGVQRLSGWVGDGG